MADAQSMTDAQSQSSAPSAGERGLPHPVAMFSARRGVFLAPSHGGLHLFLAEALRRQDRFAEAAASYRAACEADPISVEAAFGLAESLAAMVEVDEARMAYLRAIEIDPTHVRSLSGLAMLLARTGEAELAISTAERALKLSPSDAEATAALAAGYLAEERYAEAEARTSQLPPDPQRPLMLQAVLDGLLADALHGLGRASEAFGAYASGHSRMRQALPSSLAAASLQAVENLDRVAKTFSSLPKEVWQASPSIDPSESAAHAFLVGFHRSGTTLFEQILASHPKVASVSEAPTLAAAEAQFLDPPGGLDTLARIDQASIKRWRDVYERAVSNAGVSPQGKLLLDKAPLSSISLPIVAKLFPTARVLIARRDPRDVVLSAFRQTFAFNRWTYAMLTLEGTARLYDKVMRLLELYREALPLQYHEVRYERLVEDLEGQTAQALGFLGLPLDASVFEFDRHARKRTISTPSASQVRKGLYRPPKAPWRAYRAEMADVLPILAPWVERFGYPPD
jgi:tetratricopeptide (TPR) repeat protein